MKYIKTVSTLALLTFVIGCSSKPKEKVKPQVDLDQCTYENTETPAPGWICKTTKGLAVYGISESTHIFDTATAVVLSNGNTEFSRKRATLSARSKISQNIVAGLISNYNTSVETEGGSTTKADVAKQLENSTSEVQLRGSRVVTSKVKNGKIYVLVSVPKKEQSRIWGSLLSKVDISAENKNLMMLRFEAEKALK